MQTLATQFLTRARDLAARTHLTLTVARIRLSPPPRDARGRYLSSSWLHAAETFTARDLQFFRAPLRGL